MDRIIVITGGTSGIGELTAKLFEEAGSKVIVLARNIDIENPMHYECDVSNENDLIKVFADILKRFGRIDILINNAGYGLSGITELIETSEAKQLFDVNFFGVWLTTKHALPLMKKGGRIVNISSAMVYFPLPYRSFYAASKAAVNSLTFAQRGELNKIGIDICSICPGDIKTNFTKNRVKDFKTNERYGDAIKKATAKLDSRENKRMSAEYVAKQIYNIANKQKTKPMYIIGKKYKFLYFLSKLFPLSILLKAIDKYTQ